DKMGNAGIFIISGPFIQALGLFILISCLNYIYMISLFLFITCFGGSLFRGIFSTIGIDYVE
ncbi:MAG: hypothetical protein ACP5L4_06505, partial [Thermoplasmata archaeon]